MTNETPDQKLSRLTGTTLSQSTIPKADLLMKGDGNIVIRWYVKTNLLNDRYTFITDFGTATPPIYITDPVKEGVVLSARSAIEDYLPVACLIFPWRFFTWITSLLMIPLTSY